MLVARVIGLERLSARLERRAAQLAGARQTSLSLTPEARWRRAALLWPGFGSPSNQG